MYCVIKLRNIMCRKIVLYGSASICRFNERALHKHVVVDFALDDARTLAQTDWRILNGTLILDGFDIAYANWVSRNRRLRVFCGIDSAHTHYMWIKKQFECKYYMYLNINHECRISHINNILE